MTINQAIEKELQYLGIDEHTLRKTLSVTAIRWSLERIAQAAQSPLMLKDLQEKTRRETLEEAARVCEAQIVYNSLPNPDIEYGLGFEEARSVIAAAIRALSTNDTV